MGGQMSVRYMKLQGDVAAGKVLMKKSKLIPAAILLGAWLSSHAESGKKDPAGRKPNVVFIITDDQSWDTFGFMGGNVSTPRIDRMKDEGIYLSDFNVTTSVCSPSRYSFLSGRYAGRCRGKTMMQLHPPGSETRIENFCELEPELLNLPKLLQANGYRTGLVGKSHLFHTGLEGSDLWKLNGLQSYAQNADPRDPQINAKMQNNHRKWCEEVRAQGFDYADGVYAANLLELHNDALNAHNLDWTVSKAFRFLEESRDQPFFLYFSTTLHHGPNPWVAEDGKFVYSLEADPRMTGEGFVAEGFNVLPSRQSVFERNAAAGKPRRNAFALWLDDGVGAILDKIKSLGLEENTIVFFVPDHGSYRTCKATLYDYGMHVPMLVQWKGRIQPGSTYDGITANIDVAPTILDLCGITPPPDYPHDGKSFKSALFGSREPIRDHLFSEIGYSRAVKSKTWKYIAVRYPEEVRHRIERGAEFPGYAENPAPDRPYLTRNTHLGFHSARDNPHYFEADQLYNLETDPEETNNVFSQYPEVAGRMQKTLSAELRQFPDRPFGEFTGETPPVAPVTLGARAGSAFPVPASDSAVTTVQVEGRTAWQAQQTPGRMSYLYFKIDQAGLRAGQSPEVMIAITYLDRGNTEMIVQYDSSDSLWNPNPGEKPGAFKPAGTLRVRSSNAWKTRTFKIRDARFEGFCHGADIRIGFSAPDCAPVVADVSVYTK